MNFLYILESIRNPILDVVMSIVTYVGDEAFFLLAALFVFWCVDKKSGYLVLAVGFSGTLVNQFMKITWRIPRPWVLDPNFTIVESAREAATGYSFPSGHSTNAVGTLGAIAVSSKKKLIWILCTAGAILVPLSRMYLGVHTPKDVVVGSLIAIVCVAIFAPLMNLIYKTPKNMYAMFITMLVIANIYLVYTFVLNYLEGIDPENLYEAQKNACSLVGSLIGVLIAYTLERRDVNFDTKAPLLGQILKLVLGVGIAVGIKSGLKPLFNLIFGDALIAPNVLRYMIVVIFAVYVWPKTFKFFAKIGAKK